MDSFTERLAEIEERQGTRLRVTTDDFTIVYDETLPRPFRKKQVIEVERLFPGRLGNEYFCHASERIVKVIGRIPDKQRFTVQIIRDKHNIYTAKAT